MSLSIHKLEKLLIKNNIIIKSFFVNNNTCVFLDVINIVNADNFLLYIPEKYKIKIDNYKNSYKIKYIEINSNGEIPLDYAGEPDNFNFQENYDQIKIKNNDRTNMEKFLEDDYNHLISLKNLKKSDIKNLREILRQLRRLRFCIKNTNYKLSIMFKNYLCYITRNDKFDCILIGKEYTDKNLKLFIYLDLESFYEKINSIKQDITVIKEGIYKILDKNQLKNTKYLENLLRDPETYSLYSENIMVKKLEYSKFLENLYQLLIKINKAHENNTRSMIETNQKYNNNKSLYKDIQKSHELSKYKTELLNIKQVKNDIIENILLINEKRTNLALKVDKIYFDNIIMLDAINNNFNILSEY
jgi:hypothetical protein